ncbi:uncharacterized protein LOC124363106 [Homalodisca vitripennis]|nr:uncharacterized protein LOC124363106 [Homalodisca vitripennis]
MISECTHKHYSEENGCQDEDKTDEKLTSELMSCPTFQQQIRDIVFTLIPEVPRLKDLFLSWEALTVEDKDVVEHYGKTNSTGLGLYKPILEALRHWDRVQDTQGAPGCDPGMVTLSGQPQIEAALTKAVYTLECLVSKLHDDSSSEHLGTYSISRLSSSLRSVYDDEKDRGDNNGDNANHSCFTRRSLSLDDLPKLLTKKASVFSL